MVFCNGAMDHGSGSSVSGLWIPRQRSIDMLVIAENSCKSFAAHLPPHSCPPAWNCKYRVSSHRVSARHLPVLDIRLRRLCHAPRFLGCLYYMLFRYM